MTYKIGDFIIVIRDSCNQDYNGIVGKIKSFEMDSESRTRFYIKIYYKPTNHARGSRPVNPFPIYKVDRVRKLTEDELDELMVEIL